VRYSESAFGISKRSALEQSEWFTGNHGKADLEERSQRSVIWIFTTRYARGPEGQFFAVGSHFQVQTGLPVQHAVHFGGQFYRREGFLDELHPLGHHVVAGDHFRGVAGHK